MLYQVVQEYWPEFQAELASHGKYLPAYVTKEFEAFLKCGRLEYGFLRVLGIVYRSIATHLAHKAGFSKPLVQTGAVTLIQRFGSALNLNIHFHMLFLDGVYIGGSNGRPLRFQRVWAPTNDELIKLTHSIALRVARHREVKQQNPVFITKPVRQFAMI